MTDSLVFLAAALTIGSDAAPPPRSADEVIAIMMARDRERQANLHGYTAERRYVLQNESHHKRAEMLVRMTCREDGSKEFEIVSASGWGGARKYVFPHLLDAEAEASRPDVREESRITPVNYRFDLAGTEEILGRAAYVIAIEPKNSNKYLTRGRVWIDAVDFAIIRVEGRPARNPSFWIKSVHFVHEYEKNGPFWFPASDKSVTDVRIFGGTELTIEYFDYAPNAASVSGGINTTASAQ